MYTQKISNHIALIIPRITGLHVLRLILGNEDPLDKKIKDKEILEEALPDYHKVLTTREPLKNFADPELCGKWKVKHPSPHSDVRSVKSCCSTGSDRVIKSSSFHIQSDY